MTNLNTEIQMKVDKYKALQEELSQLERSLKSDLITLDKNTFGGKTWYEYLSTVAETIELDGGIVIKLESYRLTGTMPLSDNVELTLDSTIYTHDSRYRPTLHYKDSGRNVSDTFPKKYSDQIKSLEKVMEQYKVERPSDKYAKDARLTAF